MQSAHGGFIGRVGARPSRFSDSSVWHPEIGPRAFTDLYMMFGERLMRMQVEIVPFPVEEDHDLRRAREYKYSLIRFLIGEGDLRKIPFVYRPNERVGQENVIYPVARLYCDDEITEKLPRDIRDELREGSFNL